MVGMEVVRPSLKGYTLWYDITWIIGGSLLIALSAQIAFPLPFSPVPVTAQTLVVLLVGALLGRQRGALSLLAYLAEGAMGWPVFAHGTGGLSHLMGPTGGYLFGFVAAAWITGWLAERSWDRRVGAMLLLMLAGNVGIYALGLPWLAYFVGPHRALALGLYPFVVGDLAKLLCAALLLPSGWRLLRAGENPA